MQTLQAQNTLREYRTWYTTRDPRTLESVILFHSDVISTEGPLQEFRARLTSAGRGLVAYVKQLKELIAMIDIIIMGVLDATSVKMLTDLSFPSFPEVLENQEKEIVELAAEWNLLQLQPYLNCWIDELKSYFGY